MPSDIQDTTPIHEPSFASIPKSQRDFLWARRPWRHDAAVNRRETFAVNFLPVIGERTT